ncbi:MAG: hypothetical protein KDA24_28205, partial [Deltaproteobacteria bacterium]|nr:hypothetical protein [Deltaproteobacteria bacterium]
GACFASLFAISGAVILLWGIQGALASRKVLMHGTPSVGQVSAVSQSGSFWMLSYLYEVDGTMLAASLQTSDPIVLKYKEGDALHVVYDPDEPADSSVWPPLKLAF